MWVYSEVVLKQPRKLPVTPVKYWRLYAFMFCDVFYALWCTGDGIWCKLKASPFSSVTLGLLVGALCCIKHLLAALHARHGFHVLPPVTHLRRLLLHREEHRQVLTYSQCAVGLKMNAAYVHEFKSMPVLHLVCHGNESGLFQCVLAKKIIAVALSVLSFLLNFFSNSPFPCPPSWLI